jgi:hypothetical protein
VRKGIQPNAHTTSYRSSDRDSNASFRILARSFAERHFRVFKRAGTPDSSWAIGKDDVTNSNRPCRNPKSGNRAKWHRDFCSAQCARLINSLTWAGRICITNPHQTSEPPVTIEFSLGSPHGDVARSKTRVTWTNGAPVSIVQEISRLSRTLPTI